MKREVVQDFLNLPGITGVALMDGRSRPFFYGVDQALNFQQKEALAQGIQQVVETTPEGFEFYEFQFTGYQVYIYRLDHGMILLVVTGAGLVHLDYENTVERLKTELKHDAANAIANFRLVAGNLTLSNQYWKQSPASPAGNTYRPIPTPSPAPSPPVSSNGAAEPVAKTTSQPPVVRDSPVIEPIASAAAAPPPEEPPVTVKDLIAALNHFSQFTTQYLGTTVVANYWKTTRPNNIEWLNHFQVDRSAQFTLSDPETLNLSHPVTPEQHQWVQTWAEEFIKRCSKVIRDFHSIIEQRALDDEQKRLLLPKPSN